MTTPYREFVCGWLVGLWSVRWLLVLPAVTLLLPAIVLAVRPKDRYRAEVLVQVRPLRPENIGHALPQEPGDRTDEVMPAVRDRVLALPNVQAALPTLLPTASPDDRLKAQEAQDRFVYEMVGHSAFHVALEDEDPRVAADAVNTLIRAFLEGERADRLRRAESNSAFHQQELAEARLAYGRVLDRLEAFRREHGESLPDRKDFLQAELRRLEAERTTLVGVAEATRQRAQSLEQQLLTLVSEGPRGSARGANAAEEALRIRLSKDQEVLASAHKQLAEASVRYTERHPDVVRLRAAVDTYQSAVQTTLQELDRVRRAEQGQADESWEAQIARRRGSLEQMLAGAQRALSGAEEQLAANRVALASVQTNLDRVPITTAAYQPLEREWVDASGILDARERDAAAARAAADFYRRGDGADVTGYRVNAWASPPVRPSGPKRWRYPATALLLAAALSYGLIRLSAGVRREVVTTAEEVERLFPGAVVVSVGVALPGAPRRHRAFLREAALAAYMVAMVGASAWFVAAHKGWIDAPTWMRPFLGHLG